jgi:hypothetical protein
LRIHILLEKHSSS